MQKQNAGAFRLPSVRWFRAIQIAFGGVLMMVASSHAGVLTASWTAPTTNTDGSALTDLSFYRVYYSTSDSPCQGRAFFVVPSPTSIPQQNQRLSFQLTDLTTASIYNVSITAVNTSGNESFCSEIASAIARDDSTAIPIAQDHNAPGSVTTPTGQDHNVIGSSPPPTADFSPPPTGQDHFVGSPPPPDTPTPSH